MGKADKIGIATFVMRNKEYLVAIRPEADVLALETMYFADEIRDPTVERSSGGSRAGATAKAAGEESKTAGKVQPPKKAVGKGGAAGTAKKRAPTSTSCRKAS